MEILTTSIRIIDYENNIVFSRETPESFDEYVKQFFFVQVIMNLPINMDLTRKNIEKEQRNWWSFIKN